MGKGDNMATRINRLVSPVRPSASALARHSPYSGEWLLELALVTAVVAAIVSAVVALNGASF